MVLSKFSKTEKGFSIVEVLVAITILGIALISLPGAIIGLTKFNTSMQIKTEAMAAAQKRFEKIRALDISSLPTSGSTSETITIDSHDFEVTTFYCTNPNYCVDEIRHFKLEVDYQGEQLYNVETIFTHLQ